MNRTAFLRTRMRIILRGHLLNPLWLPRQERRRRRGEATRQAVLDYLEKMMPPSDNRQEQPEAGTSQDRHIWTLWLQGEEQAPAIVRSCLRSMRERLDAHIHVLSERDILQHITLPGYILEKWRAGRIRPAHFADICRTGYGLRIFSFTGPADKVAAVMPSSRIVSSVPSAAVPFWRPGGKRFSDTGGTKTEPSTISFTSCCWNMPSGIIHRRPKILPGCPKWIRSRHTVSGSSTDGSRGTKKK